MPPAQSPAPHALPYGESPIDVASTPARREDARDGVGWAWGVALTSTLALVLGNSHALANWADQLPPSTATAPLVAWADAWHDRAGRYGFNQIVDATEAGADALRTRTWPQTAGAHSGAQSGAQSGAWISVGSTSATRKDHAEQHHR